MAGEVLLPEPWGARCPHQVRCRPREPDLTRSARVRVRGVQFDARDVAQDDCGACRGGSRVQWRWPRRAGEVSMRELHVECAGKRDAPAPAFRVRSARPSMWRSGTLRWTRVSAGEGASKPADERLGERTIAIKHWIEDGDLDPDCAPGVHGELDHRLQFAPAQPAASPVIHGRHDGIIESIAVNVDPEAVELGGNEARQGVRRGPPHPVPLMSHATARPQPADTSFESQTATTTGRRIESDPSRGLATLREGPAAASRHSIRRL
jgi:hypothetical protein